MKNKKKPLIIAGIFIAIAAIITIGILLSTGQDEKVDTDVIKETTQSKPKEEKNEDITNTYYTSNEYQALSEKQKTEILERNSKMLKESGKDSFCGRNTSDRIILDMMNKLTLGLVVEAKEVYENSRCLPDGLNPKTFSNDMSLLNDYINTDNTDKRIKYLQQLSNKISLGSFIPAAGPLYAARIVSSVKSEIPVFNGTMEIDTIKRIDKDDEINISNQYKVNLEDNFIIAVYFKIEDINETKNGKDYETQSWVAYLSEDKNTYNNRLLFFENLDSGKEFSSAAFWNDYYQSFK